MVELVVACLADAGGLVEGAELGGVASGTGCCVGTGGTGEVASQTVASLRLVVPLITSTVTRNVPQ